MSKIGIDIADTVIDVWPSLIKKAKQFNLEHSNNKPSEEKHLYLPEDIYGWSKAEKEKFWNCYGQEITFSSLVKEGVVDTLQYFKKLGYLIYFITAKTEDTYADLEKKIIELLVKNNMPYDKIFMQVSNKGKFCFENGIEYLIDDSFDNCSKANQYGIKSLLMTNE